MAIWRPLAMGAGGLAVAAIGGLFALAQSSQKGSAPGLANGELAPCPSSPNCVSSEAGTPDEKRVAPLPLEAWEALPRAIAQMGGKLTTSRADYIHARFESQTFGFVDDLELRKGADAVHLRSASRVGYSDRGVNAARVEELRTHVAH